MSITRDTVVHTARLARIELTNDEIERFGEELSRITGYMAQLAEAVSERSSAQAVLPLSTSSDTLRDDNVCADSVGTTVLSRAPGSDGKFFCVPRVID